MRLRQAQLKTLIAACALTACTNGLHSLPQQASVSGNGSGTIGVVSNPSANYRISSIDFAAPSTGSTTSSSSSSGSGSSTPAVAVTVRLDITPPFTDFTQFCGASSSGTTCNCYFRWSEVNPNATYTVTIPRYVENQLNLVQPSLVQCNAPDNWYATVPDGTTIQIGVKPAQGLSEFAMPAFSYVKNPSTTQGTFADSQGRAFDNILHYSCYDQFQKGNTIINRTASINVTNGGTTTTISSFFANDFCLVNTELGGTPPAGCPGASSLVDYSAESNYYNLYTRASDRGTINGTSNGRYTCPTVEEPLAGGTQAAFWPLDASFALALSPNPDFSVAVDGFTHLAYGNDPTSVATTCYSTPGSSSGTPSDTLLTGCLGFASKPKPDGTCNTFRDASNNTRAQFRLRRFIAIYPPSFEADGQPFRQAQPSDVVYVLDRPVANPNGDPTKPFTMLGPKPCPYSYFDYKKTTAGTLTYVGTSNAAWTGKNYDGLQFPNTDSANSCSALVALANSSKTVVSYATINTANPINVVTGANPITALNQVYIRPTQAWAPHYEEDSSFQACAPQSTPVKDPPLHFSKDANGNVTYCAEMYPTQNGNVAHLDALGGATGSVVPYTSHSSKNSSSVACAAAPPAGLAAGYAGPALHTGATPGGLGLDAPAASQTCDRTIPQSSDAFYRLPLTESPAQVEAAMAADPSYDCTVTWDNGGTKKGATTPTGGCCGANVLMNTGLGGNASAHLEPISDATTATQCLIPAY